jgi:hypothetical protein
MVGILQVPLQNTIAFRLCGEYNSTLANQLEYICRQKVMELIMVGFTSCYDDLIAYALCTGILILFVLRCNGTTVGLGILEEGLD